MKIKYTMLVLLGVLGVKAANAQGLKDAYADFFRMGVAVNQRNVMDAEQQQLICREYNSVTAENDMKPASLHPADGV